jgi:hypothetical protein
MSYQKKYLKYKNKYLILKNQLGGDICNKCGSNITDGKCKCNPSSVPAAAAAAPVESDTVDHPRCSECGKQSANLNYDKFFGARCEQCSNRVTGLAKRRNGFLFDLAPNLHEEDAAALRLVNTVFKKAVDRRVWPKKQISGEFILSVGSWGSGVNQYRAPVGMCSAVDPSGNPLLLVCDSLNKRVVVADASDGTFKRALGPAGTFYQPEYVAFVPATGQVLVADFISCRVAVFAGVDDNTVVRTLGDGRGPGLLQLYAPSGLAVLDGDVADAPDGPVAVIADTLNNRLALWRVRDGTVVRHLGSYGTAPGQFYNPTAVTVVPAQAVGNDETWLVVADSGNRRVQVLTCTGTVVRVLQGDAIIKLGGELCSVTVSIGVGEVLVTDRHKDRVVSWRLSDGGGLRVVCGGVQGSGPGQLAFPTGVVALDNGTLWVAEDGNRRLSLFR